MSVFGELPRKIYLSLPREAVLIDLLWRGLLIWAVWELGFSGVFALDFLLSTLKQGTCSVPSASSDCD